MRGDGDGALGFFPRVGDFLASLLLMRIWRWRAHGPPYTFARLSPGTRNSTALRESMNSPAKGAGKKTLSPGGAGGSAQQKTSAKNAQERAAKKAARTAQTPRPAGPRKVPARPAAGAGRSDKSPGRSGAETPPGRPSTANNQAPTGSRQARSHSSSSTPPSSGPRPTLRRAGLSAPRWDALELPDQRAQLKRYYRGARMPSPVGGFLEPLRVRTEEDGSGALILECSASSLRFVLPIPAATRSERRTIKKSQANGTDPTCPRHHPSQWLKRVGPYLVCPLCGVRYGRA